MYERAWTLRGMEALLMDFVINPDFVHELMGAICDYNITQIKQALKYDIDAIKLGDDWGQQRGLIMGQDCWNEFIKPYLARIFIVVKDAGKFVFIHSCGDVDELFDPLVEIGLDNFHTDLWMTYLRRVKDYWNWAEKGDMYLPPLMMWKGTYRLKICLLLWIKLKTRMDIKTKNIQNENQI